MQERQTKQKTIIYTALKELNHPTATEVYARVHEESPTVSRATVFRVLGGFAASGQALELRFAGSEVRYDYNVKKHSHIRCGCCGKVADVEFESYPLKKVEAKVSDNFVIEDFAIEFFGKCEGCNKMGNFA